MPKKVRDILKMLKKDGWYELPRTGSSHRQFKHPTKKGRVTVAVHKLSDDVDIEVEKSIMKQAGLKK